MLLELLLASKGVSPMECESKRRVLTNMAVGVGAVLVTFALAAGTWGVFDLVIALAVCVGLFHAVKHGLVAPRGMGDGAVLALMFAGVTTALLVAGVATLATFTSSPRLATVDATTYESLRFDDDDRYVVYRISESALGAIKAGDSVKRKIGTLVGREFRSEAALRMAVRQAMDEVPFMDGARAMSLIAPHVGRRSLLPRLQASWRITLYVLSLIAWCQLLYYLPRRRGAEIVEES